MDPNASEFVPGAWRPAPSSQPPAQSWEDREEKDEKAQKPQKKKSEKKKVEKEVKKEEKKEETNQQTKEEEKKLEEALAELKVDEEPVEKREHLNVIFIGHVDHGKSTICGNILALTGNVDPRTLEKYKQEATDRNRAGWFYALIMDLIEEERAKGKTVEVGRAHFETEKKRYTILDCPGHENFIANMIEGASQADVGVLVVSARKNEFESGFNQPICENPAEQSISAGGQTREHAILARTLGTKYLIVAVNKMDTVDWNKKRYITIKSEITKFLKKVGFNTKTDVFFLPVSGITGGNLKEVVNKDVCDWWDGDMTLLGLLDSLKKIPRPADGPVYIPVLGTYKDERSNHIVTGKVECGTLVHDQDLLVVPGDAKLKVLGISNAQQELNVALPGENVEITIPKQSKGDASILKGFVLCHPSFPIQAVNEFVGQIAIIDLPDHTPVFSKGYNAVIHIHTCTEECTVVNLLAEIDKKTGKKMRAKFVRVRAQVDVHLKISHRVPMTLFSEMPQLGRFTLRDSGRTVAFGKVLRLGAPIKKKRGAQ